MKYSVKYICLFFIINSCSQIVDHEQEIDREKVKYTMTLKEIGAPRRIPLDSLTLPIDPLDVFINNDVVEIGLLNTKQHILQIYDLQEGRLQKKIKIPVEIDNPTHHYILNSDSIFVFNSYKYTAYLINEDGVIKGKFPLLVDSLQYQKALNGAPDPLTENHYIALPLPDNRNPIIMIKPYLIVRCIPWIDPFSPDYFKYGMLRMKINLNMKNDISYFFKYPEIFAKDNKYPTKFFNEASTYNSIRNQLVLDFPADNYVYSTDINGVVIKKHWAGSEHFNKVNPMNRYEDNSVEQAEHSMNNSFYERILFDQFRNVYYRLVWHSDKVNKFSFSDSNMKINIELGVIILDGDLNKVGEVTLPKHVTNTFWFVSREGLFIQSNVDEVSNLSFQLFELTDLL